MIYHHLCVQRLFMFYFTVYTRFCAVYRHLFVRSEFITQLCASIFSSVAMCYLTQDKIRNVNKEVAYEALEIYIGIDMSISNVQEY